MKRIFNCVLILISAVLLVSCMTNSPKGVVDRYLAAMEKGDYDTAIECMSFKKEISDNKKQQLKSLMKEKGEKEFKKHDGIKGYEIVEENIDSDSTATVRYVIYFNDGKTDENTANMEKKNGNWYLKSGK